MLVVLNLPMIGLWIELLSIPYKWLFPAIVLFCAIGVYPENNYTFEIWMVAVFCIVGYVFHKLGCGPAPLLLGLILGPMMEETCATPCCCRARAGMCWSLGRCRHRCCR